MYNRYMRNDDGTYTRIPEEEPVRPAQGQSAGSGPERQHPPEPQAGSRDSGGQDRRGDRDPSGQEQHRSQDGHSRPDGPGPERQSGWTGDPFHGPPPAGDRSDGLTGFLRHFLDRWHLNSVDTGDLLLLGLLFFLFREDADEELLVALGLLLIL